jgi:hypothetical protein
MCHSQLRVNLSICFSLIFQTLTLALLIIYLVFTIDYSTFWDQLLEVRMLSNILAALSCILGLITTFALSVQAYRVVDLFEYNLKQDLEID